MTSVSTWYEGIFTTCQKGAQNHFRNDSTAVPYGDMTDYKFSDGAYTSKYVDCCSLGVVSAGPDLRLYTTAKHHLPQAVRFIGKSVGDIGSISVEAYV